MDRMPRDRASAAAAPRICRCPRCTPSKFPMTAMDGPKSRGTSSDERNTGARSDWGSSVRGSYGRLLQLNGKAQPVVSHANIVGQLSVCLFMAQFVRDVSEPGMFRADTPSPLHRLPHGGVAGMRLVAQRRKHHVIKALEQRKALIGNRAHVGEISCASEAKAADLHALRASRARAGNVRRTRVCTR